jgi:hypothetical protein
MWGTRQCPRIVRFTSNGTLASTAEAKNVLLLLHLYQCRLDINIKR